MIEIGLTRLVLEGKNIGIGPLELSTAVYSVNESAALTN
jgi:hypothetical protein